MASRGTAPKSLRIAAVQMIFGQTIAENLRKVAKAVEKAAAKGAVVVLFPECSLTGYAYDFGALQPSELQDALAVVADIARQFQVHLLVGSPVHVDRKLFNALLVFDRRGRLVHAYAKCQLVEADRRWFTPGNALSLFKIDGIPCTAIICHERRYPELVRLPVMAGAQVIFHPNAGMDALAVSRRKRNGNDGIPVRAFENAAYYVFANSVGPQGNGKWSAGDTKIVAPDGSLLRLADNQRESIQIADLEIGLATRKYALDSLEHPRFLRPHWRQILAEMRRRIRASDALFRKQLSGGASAQSFARGY